MFNSTCLFPVLAVEGNISLAFEQAEATKWGLARSRHCTNNVKWLKWLFLAALVLTDRDSDLQIDNVSRHWLGQGLLEHTVVELEFEFQDFLKTYLGLLSCSKVMDVQRRDRAPEPTTFGFGLAQAWELAIDFRAWPFPNVDMWSRP